DLRNRQVKSDAKRTAPSFTELRQLDIAMRRAMSSVRREADELRKTAFSNPHNGLPNYAALTRYLDQHLKTTDFGHPLALYRLDLDHFDRACESFGSDVGEALLREAVARIRRELNDLTERGLIECSGYFLAQIWADNLFLVLPNIGGRGDASAVARALRSAFVAPVKLGNYDITLGLSGGIVMAPEDGTLRTDLLRRSETALRAVREDGKRGFRFYAPRLDRVATGRAQLETEMREGIEKGEFVPYFQPKIDLRSGRIQGCEALARWQRPEGRFISPAAFIPVAEETGLIEKIGQQILFASCQQAANWLRDGLPMTVAVNVSPLELRNPGFRNQVLSALTETGLPPSYLELEITESVAVEDPKAFREMFNPLKAMGVRLAVDDFGTGHSNLATLTQLHFDVFKIDRQFVHSLGQESSSQPIVEMILAMADSIGMETVAEGVETPEQARFLRERGCTFAQGFVYSKALEGREYADFARSWEARRRQRATRMSA
ncbi:MAG: bifunctional diguanylate cyclase/phosphodiesterase, partial [Hyphomonadaceae bacterium]|nr:bifunctional diguanylate cyclase/phosphodiesterase [Hyphomonadaceae bacterium]